MLRIESFEGIYLHRDRVDFRKSIDGLAAIVEQEMGLDLFGRHLFLFCNRNRTRLKVLYWDSTGFVLWYKRLEQDRFVWPRKHDEEVIEITGDQLRWLLSGYDVWRMRPHEKVQYARVS
jgi:transposase